MKLQTLVFTLLTNTLLFPQLPGTDFHFEFNSSFIDVTFDYPDSMYAWSYGGTYPNSLDIVTVSWEKENPQKTESNYLPPEEYVSLHVFTSPDDLIKVATNEYMDLADSTTLNDLLSGNRGNDTSMYILNFGSWQGIKVKRLMNYAGTAITKPESRYLLMKRTENDNIFILAQQRNTRDIEDILLKVIKSFKYKSTPFITQQKIYEDIKKVDFFNFEYGNDSTGKFRIRDSIYYEESNETNPYFYELTMYGIVYGDLTGDNKDEAAIMAFEYQSGATGRFTDGYVYTLANGIPIMIYKIPGGDRAEGGLEGVEIKNGLLKIHYNDGLGGLCCPEYLCTSFNSWNGSTFEVQDCEMTALIEPHNVDTLRLNSIKDKNIISDSLKFEAYFKMYLENGKQLSIDAVHTNTRWAFNMVLTDAGGKVIGGCPNLDSSNLDLYCEVPETGDYFLRVVSDDWETDHYILSINYK